MPSHTHTVQAASSGGQANPIGNAFASAGFGRPPLYAPTSANNVQMSPLATSIAGGDLPHNNMPPYLGLTFIIALQGVFPARS
jgi:microcystin-dependent protein